MSWKLPSEVCRRGSVSRLVLFKELDHFLDPVALELLMNRVQIISLVLPEVDLSVRTWVVSRLQGGLRVLLQHVLDLAGPGDDGALKDVSLVLVALVVISGDVRCWQREESSSLHLPDCDVNLAQEEVEFIHEVLRNKVAPSNLILGVAKNGVEDIVG